MLFLFSSVSFKNAKAEKTRTFNWNFTCCICYYYFCFSHSPGCGSEKNIWNAKIIQATPQNSHIIKFISNFWLLLFSHFSFAFLLLSHSSNCQQWRQIGGQFLKVRMKSLNCNYEDWKSISCCCLFDSSHLQFRIQTLHSTKL